jgi:hypothetical protein
MSPHVPYGLRGLPSRLWPKCNWRLRLRRPWSVVPMGWMVICKYEVPGGALNPSSTKLPRPRSPWESSPSRKNPQGRTGNRTRDLTISSQKLRPLDHEVGPSSRINYHIQTHHTRWDSSGRVNSSTQRHLSVNTPITSDEDRLYKSIPSNKSKITPFRGVISHCYTGIEMWHKALPWYISAVFRPNDGFFIKAQTYSDLSQRKGIRLPTIK